MSHRVVVLALSMVALACNGGSCGSSDAPRATRPRETATATATETAAPTATATAAASSEKRETVDAAADRDALAAEASREDVVAPSGDTCPTGYARGADPTKCHRRCRRDTDCHAPNVCMSIPGQRGKFCDVQR